MKQSWIEKKNWKIEMLLTLLCVESTFNFTYLILSFHILIIFRIKNTETDSDGKGWCKRGIYLN